MNWNVVFYEEIDSTNLEARRLSQNGAGQGLVVTADKQSAGKGRRGRTWESPAEGNLYFSILLRPDFAPEKAPMLTILMAYSVASVLNGSVFLKAQAVEVGEYTPHEMTNIDRQYCDDRKVQIKWPNDVIISGKKACGILTEMNLTGCQIEDVVIGVGINVNMLEFPKELQDKATSLRLELGKEIEREDLLEQILREFEKQYEHFEKEQDLSFLQEEYNQMLVNRNREVLVLEPKREYQVQALGINEAGELLVKKDDGSVEPVFAGEVSVRGIYGYV